MPLRCGRAARPVRLFRPEAGRAVARGEQVATLLAEISAINAELLARRELR